MEHAQTCFGGETFVPLTPSMIYPNTLLLGGPKVRHSGTGRVFVGSHDVKRFVGWNDSLILVVIPGCPMVSPHGITPFFCAVGLKGFE